jgi:protein-tyrosine kinase
MTGPDERDPKATNTEPGVARDPLIERAAQLLKQGKATTKAARADKRPVSKTLEPVHSEHQSSEVKSDLTSSIGAKIDEGPVADTQPPGEPYNGENGSPGDDEHGYIAISATRARRERVLMPGTDQMRAVAEFREIKRSVLYSLSSRKDQSTKNPNLILVTSARPGEGKTFISINLAISLAAEKDIDVLLVDVDHSRDRVAKTLGISAEKGLLDVVENKSMSLNDVTLDTNIENFSVVPSGTYHPMGAELFSSARMRDLLDDLSRENSSRIVIFDCPPVLATTEASILAEHVGHVLFVVEASKTTKGNIKDALELLGHSQNLGFILNKTRNFVGDTSFGSYSGYGYGYGEPSQNR